MQDDQDTERRPIFRDDEDDVDVGQEGPGPDILPENAPRGGITVPDANDTGITTPPISGWGEVPSDDEDAERT